jgi:signal transduction histidine kinase
MTTLSLAPGQLVRPFARLFVFPRRLVGRLTLAQRFALACLAVLLLGAFIIGSWVAREIEKGVVERTAAITALYVDSVVGPHLTGLEAGSLSDADIARLNSLLWDTPLGEKIVSFKVWSTEGEILYGRDPGLIGQRFPIEHDLRRALGGDVGSHISNLASEENRFERQYWSQLVETYAPVHSESGEVIGVVEFYQLPGELLRQIKESRRLSWGIVTVSTVLMYFVLVGLVTGASATITRQNRSLKEAFEEQKSLQGRVRRLNQRLRQAASRKALTDEELFRRVAQDLHDGPAQGLALALLRLDALERDDDSPEQRETLDAIRFSLDRALEELRGVSTVLRLPQIEGLGWREVVEKAVDEHRHRTGSVVNLRLAEIEPEPTGPQRIATYRATQEALTNSARHSGAAEQWVSLRQEDGHCVLVIEDRGRGFDPADTEGRTERRARLGLQGMKERIELLGGSLEVDTRAGVGTRLIARFPSASDAADHPGGGVHD